MPVFYAGQGNGFLQGGSDPGQSFMDAFKKSKLSSLLGQAYQSPQANRGTLLEQIARIDPEMARQAEAQFQERDQQAQAKLVQDARLASGLYRNSNNAQAQTAYSALRERAQQALGGAQLPDELDDGTAGMLEQYAQINGPQGSQLAPRVVGNALVDANGRVIYQAPDKPEKPQAATFQTDRDGNGWWLRPGEAPIPADMPSDGNGAGAGLDQPGLGAADLSGAPLYAAVGDVVGPLGGRITSTNGGQHNPGSAHYGGGAVDIGMARETPEQQAAIIARLQNDPRFRVRDERTRPPGQSVWGGPHVHVEPNSGGAQQRPRINFGKPQERVQTLSPAEVASYGLPLGTVAQVGADGSLNIVSKPESNSAQEKPIPVNAIGKVLDAQEALGATQVVSDIIAKHAKRMTDGSLDLYPEDAIGAKVRTTLGRTNKNDVNVNEWRADMTRIVNESLRLNKGVQTEGDAQRAVQELMAANDNKTAARALQRLAHLNQRAVLLRRQMLRTVYGNYGRDENGEPAGRQQPAAGGWSIQEVP